MRDGNRPPGVLRQFVQRPRQVGARRVLFQVHLWVGLLFAVYLLVISLSGTVLVFKDELTRWTLPSTLHPYTPGTSITPEAIMARVARDDPGAQVTMLEMPSPVLPAFLLQAKDARGRPHRWFADPVTGALTPAPRTWLDTILALHDFLLLPTSWGMQANGVGAAALLLLAATGLVLWWPGLRFWTRGLRVTLRGHWRRVNFDLHNAIGFWTLAIVVWWAVSGVYFAWYRPVTAAVNAVSPLQGMRAPTTLVGIASRQTGTPSLAAVLAAAAQASPTGRLWSVGNPSLQGEESYVLLDRGAPGDFSHRDIVRVRLADAHVVSVWHYGERHSAGDWFLWLMHPLHFGTVWGFGVKVIWAMLGLSLAVLTATGVLMYWNRYLRKLRPRWR